MPTSQDLLDHFLTLHPDVIDLSLDRIKRLLDAMGNPQERLPNVVHIAGTNGKGSVVAYLKAMGEAAGLRVHVYTSPHLIRFHERIVLAGEEISEAHLVEALDAVKKANGEKPITFFEATTAAAFWAMSQVEADLVLLETGLGGRLDATNVIKRPALTILTPISLDHEEYLGGHIEAIAAEKSFIMKPGVACLSAKQDRKASKIIEMRSLELGCPTIKEGQDWFVRTRPEGIVMEGWEEAIIFPFPALTGAHQLRNAGLALQAAKRLAKDTGLPLSFEAMAKGLTTVTWPGRLHGVTSGPLAEMLPKDWTLWLDGGHNPAAAKVLAQQSRAWKGRSLLMIVGMMADKKAGPFLKAFGPKCRALRAVPVESQGARGAKPDDLTREALAAGVLEAQSSESVIAALESLKADHPGPAAVLITGSLYLAGQVLETLPTEAH